MFNWLYDFPDVVTALLFAVAGAVLFAAAPFFRAKLLGVKVAPDHAAVARSTLSVVIGFTGVLLAFSLVQAQENFRITQQAVGTEAHDLAQMDRLLVRYGEAVAYAIRPDLRDYANSIVVDEWPLLREGKPSGKTGALFGPISSGVIALEPAPGRESLIYTELLKQADQIAEDREARLLAAAELRLPSIFWTTTFFLFATMVLMATFCETAFPHVAALGIEGFGLSLLVALTFFLDSPFQGQLVVLPKPIEKAVEDMQFRIQ